MTLADLDLAGTTTTASRSAPAPPDRRGRLSRWLGEGRKDGPTAGAQVGGRPATTGQDSKTPGWRTPTRPGSDHRKPDRAAAAGRWANVRPWSLARPTFCAHHCSAANPAGSPVLRACSADLFPGGSGGAAAAGTEDSSAARVADRLTPRVGSRGTPRSTQLRRQPAGPADPAPVSADFDPAALPSPQRAAPRRRSLRVRSTMNLIGWTGVVPGGTNPYDAAPSRFPVSRAGSGSTPTATATIAAARTNPRDHLENPRPRGLPGSAIWSPAFANGRARAHRRGRAWSRAVLVVCDGVPTLPTPTGPRWRRPVRARTVLDQPLAVGRAPRKTTAAAAVRGSAMPWRLPSKTRCRRGRA